MSDILCPFSSHFLRINEQDFSHWQNTFCYRCNGSLSVADTLNDTKEKTVIEYKNKNIYVTFSFLKTSKQLTD